MDGVNAAPMGDISFVNISTPRNNRAHLYIGTETKSLRDSPRLFEAVSASRPACRIPIDASMRRNCSTAKERTLRGFSSSRDTTYSGRIRERIPVKNVELCTSTSAE